MKEREREEEEQETVASEGREGKWNRPLGCDSVSAVIKTEGSTGKYRESDRERFD